LCSSAYLASVFSYHFISDTSASCYGIEGFIFRKSLQAHEHYTQYIALVECSDSVLSMQIDTFYSIRKIYLRHVYLQSRCLFALHTYQSLCS